MVTNEVSNPTITKRTIHSKAGKHRSEWWTDPQRFPEGMQEMGYAIPSAHEFCCTTTGRWINDLVSVFYVTRDECCDRVNPRMMGSPVGRRCLPHRSRNITNLVVSKTMLMLHWFALLIRRSSHWWKDTEECSCSRRTLLFIQQGNWTNMSKVLMASKVQTNILASGYQTDFNHH